MAALHARTRARAPCGLWAPSHQSRGSRSEGASRPGQVEDCVGALKNLEFSDTELAEIDRYATEANINLWAKSAERDGPQRN